MLFQHQSLSLPDIDATTSPSGRVYHTPEGDFPSVTTVLGQALDHSYLDAWKAREGENAKRILQQASVRGSAFHTLAEKYLNNDPHWRRGAMPVNVDTFLSIKKFLDDHVKLIYGLEVPLYSYRLYTAGRTDLIAQWDSIDSIVDFKTSKRIKTKDQILGYFLQATCYSMMLEELTGLRCPQIVIVMAIDHEDPKVFIEQRQNYEETVVKIFCDDKRIQSRLDSVRT